MKNILFKSLIFCVIGLVCCKSKQTTAVQKDGTTIEFNEKTFDPYFKGLGTEPFWNIEIDDYFIVYKDLEGNSEVFPVNRIDQAQDANVQRITSENSRNQILVTISKQSCSDGMSDNNYDFKIEIALSGKTIQLNEKGCGSFIVPKKLQASWELTMFNGKEIAKNKYLKTPYLTFESKENRLSGNASCNGINGRFFIQNKTLRFSQLATTRMMCVHENMEEAFLNELPKITNYKVVNDELQLFSGDELKMKMKKMGKAE